MTKLLPAFYSLFLFSLVSCSNDPKNRFGAKIKIGLCQENQGIVTYEAQLYADSTFYIPSDIVIDYSYGTFNITGDTILFKTIGGEKHLCDKYKIANDKFTWNPIDCPITEALNISFSN
jgi:hypothetical protein